MNLAGLMLADEARMQNGLVNVVGAGWRFVERPAFPTTLQGFAVGVLELELDEFGTVLSLQVVNPDGQDAGSSGSIAIQGASTLDAMPLRTAFSIPFSVVIPEPGGTWMFRLSGPAGPLAEVAIPVTGVS